MNLYTSLTLRYLKQNKKRTIVTIIGIILSTALICGIGNIYNSYMDYQRRATIESDGSFYATFEDISKEDINIITKSAGVSEVGFSKDIGSADLETENNNLIEIEAYDTNKFESYNLNLKEGKVPTKDNEIVVTELFITALDKKIGDTLRLDVGKRVSADGEDLSGSWVSDDEKIIDTTSKEYKIVGVIEKINSEVGKQVFIGITGLDISSLSSTDKVDISICTNKAEDIYELGQNLADKLGLRYEEYESGKYYDKLHFNEHLLRLEGASFYSNINDTLNKILILVGSLVVICTIATVYNSFSISISERKKQFGILNSIGATKSQTKKLVFLEAFIVSAIGIPIGLISGTFAIDLVFKTIQKLFSSSFISELGFRVVYSPTVLISSTLVVLLTILISAIFPAISASKVSPLEAIKNSSNLKVGKVKNSKIIEALFKTEGVLAYKNLRRNKKKFRITLFSLIISIVIFISFSGFITMFMKANYVQMGQMNYDLVVWGSNSNNEESLYNEIKDIDGVENLAYGDWNQIVVDLPKDKINEKYQDLSMTKIFEEDNNYKMYSDIKLPGDIAIKNMKLIEGSFNKEEAIKENGVILVNKTYIEQSGKKAEIEMTDYKVGDTITSTTIGPYDEDGNEITKELSFKILAITDEMPIDRNNYNENGVDFITYDEVGENLGLESMTNDIFISTNKSEYTRKTIQSICDKYGYYLNDLTEEAKDMEESIKVMKIFVYGFVLVISLVSVTNIVNTISTNINLRKKEFAIIKSIGVTPGGFNKIIYMESLLYGILALSWGIPIGIGLIVAMNVILGDMIQFGLIIPWTAIAICIVGIFVITFVSAYIPMKKINKENIIENIRQESI